MVSAYLNAGLVIGATVSLLWVLSVFKRDASIIDPFWSLFFLFATLCAIVAVEQISVVQGVFLFLVALWSLRLSFYLFWRNHGKPEDYRYAAWRKEHGSHWWWRSAVTVFLLQGVLAWVLCIPFVAVFFGGDRGLGLLELMGLLMWLVGFAFEAGGDWQLAQFKKGGAGKGAVLDSGFWRYTRHPNYFGEAAQWWGFYCFAVGAGQWWTIYAPILMTWMLLRVSGVSLLEDGLKKSKPKYADYVARTSAFIPMPPKKGSS